MKLRPLSFTRCAPSPLGCVGTSKGMIMGAGGRRRTVVVALRRDAAGRELLTWALVKAAAAGDRVIALHVSTAAATFRRGRGTPVTSAAAEEEEEERKARADRANGSLASVLSAYRGFCDRNQIDLDLKLCDGDGASSVKKALVAEATSCGASHLILGVTKNKKSSSGSSATATAVARYCAKRVPATCMVTAVSNGAVVFRREPTVHHHQHHQLLLSPYSAVVETPRRLYRKILDARTATNKSQDDMAIGGGRNVSAPQQRRNMSAAMSALVSPRLTPGRVRPLPCHGHAQEPPKNKMAAAGWPLLNLNKDNINMPALPELSEVSVVEWAMQLPDRCCSSDQLKRPDDGHVPLPEEEKDKQQQVPLPEELVSIRDKYSAKYTVFTHTELARITDGFSPDRLVGKGGAGRVYRGCNEGEGGKELAVKVLKPSPDVVKDFASEIEILSSVSHANAVSLVGFCVDGGKDRLMLVYDYMPRGSLEEALHGVGHGKLGGWPERFKVAAGVARALEYLHGDGDGHHRPMIHRDVKSSNVLVAADFEPKLCDFGLAMWADDAAAQLAGDDDVAGTFGYLAPEYFMHGKVSDKIDVYAFGVVLLELVSGRKPVSTGGGTTKGKGSLVMWANSVIQGGNIMELVDPDLPTADGDGDGGEVQRMVLAAALCIRRAHQLRPTMSNVVKLLAGDADAVSWAKSQVLGAPGDDDDNDGRHGAAVTSPEKNDIQSYINLALRDIAVDDDASSVGSAVSLEDYLKGRWSRSSSFEGSE